MTAHTTIPNTAVAAGGLPSGETVTAIRDNLYAAFEGDATAIAAGVTLQFAALNASFSTAGGLGSYVFARGTADVAFGSTVAGSTLQPTSAPYSVSASSGSAAVFNVGSALSGTWRCMGTFDLTTLYGGGGSNLGATLWLRIA